MLSLKENFAIVRFMAMVVYIGLVGKEWTEFGSKVNVETSNMFLTMD